MPSALHIALGSAAECFPVVHQGNSLESCLSKSNLLLSPLPGHAPHFFLSLAFTWPLRGPRQLTKLAKDKQSPKFNLLFHRVKFLLDQRTEPAYLGVRWVPEQRQKRVQKGSARTRETLLRTVGLANFREFLFSYYRLLYIYSIGRMRRKPSEQTLGFLPVGTESRVCHEARRAQCIVLYLPFRKFCPDPHHTCYR